MTDAPRIQLVVTCCPNFKHKLTFGDETEHSLIRCPDCGWQITKDGDTFRVVSGTHKFPTFKLVVKPPKNL